MLDKDCLPDVINNKTQNVITLKHNVHNGTIENAQQKSDFKKETFLQFFCIVLLGDLSVIFPHIWGLPRWSQRFCKWGFHPAMIIIITNFITSRIYYILNKCV